MERPLAVMCDGHGVTLPDQEIPQHLRKPGVVFGDKDARWRGHGRSIGSWAL